MRLRRFGNFLILIGLVLGVLFYFSIQSGQMDVRLLIAGLACFGVGLVMNQLFKPARVESGRFRILHRKQDEDGDEENL